MKTKHSFVIVALLATLFFTAKAEALTIAPARFEVTTDPGTDVGGTVTLLNDQDAPITFYTSYENFVAGDDNSGTPKFIGGDTGLATWMESPAEISLAPGEVQKVDFTIHVPQDATPGGYFGAIFWNTVPPSGGQVSIGAKVGMLVLLSVSGDITEGGGITAFDRAGHGFFYTALPINFSYTFRNDGSDRVQPSGTLSIRDTVFLRAKQLDANSAKGNVLPASERSFALNWSKHSQSAPQGFFKAVGYEWRNFALGLYTAKLSLTYGPSALQTHQTLRFFVLPWQLLIVVIFGLGVLLGIGRRLLRSYNRRIIARARLEQSADDPNR
jgi:hypothetical protein